MIKTKLQNWNFFQNNLSSSDVWLWVTNFWGFSIDNDECSVEHYNILKLNGEKSNSYP